MTQQNALQEYQVRTGGIDRGKQYRRMGIMTFCVAAGLAVLRIVSYYLPIEDDLLADLAFTLPMQLGILVLFPILFYRFALKMNMREIFDFGGFHKTAWYNLLLAVPIGICCHIVTIGVSNVWQNILIQLGYTHGSSPMPATFSPARMIAELALTALLPGFCEEFFNRGGLLKTIRGSFPFVTTVVIMGIEFGLFHQYVTQVFYTALFGALMAYLCLKCKSIYPAMIIHFINNACSVIDSYCSEYDLLGGGLYAFIDTLSSASGILVLAMFSAAAGIGFGLLWLLVYRNDRVLLERKRAVAADAGYDNTHGRPILRGEDDPQAARELGLDQAVYGYKVKEDLYRPTLADNAWYIGAIVLTSLTTIFSFIFGWLV